jgi:hypothetical protein
MDYDSKPCQTCFNLKIGQKWHGGEEMICSGFPMFHAAGLTIATMSICFGCTQIIIPDPRDTKKEVEEEIFAHPAIEQCAIIGTKNPNHCLR